MAQRACFCSWRPAVGPTMSTCRTSALVLAVVGCKGAFDRAAAGVVVGVGGAGLRERDDLFVRDFTGPLADALDARVADAGFVEGLADAVLVGRGGEAHGDVRAALEVDAEREVVPEEDA